MALTTGWEIVCPDGLMRHYPYVHRGDAEFDASVFDRRGCEPFTVDGRMVRCPGGKHEIRPQAYLMPPPKAQA